MKKLILSAVFALMIAATASAQTSHKQTSKHSTSPSKKKVAKPAVKIDSLNQRKNYEWKDGQEATPTGHDARGINETQYSAEKKDTSAKKKRARPGRGLK
jgi:hypothetical protein